MRARIAVPGGTIEVLSIALEIQYEGPVMSGKLISLFAHPEFVRRAQERAEQQLLELVLPLTPPRPEGDAARESDVVAALLAEISAKR